MDYQQAKLVLESVASHGKGGCGIITLANQTEIELSALRGFLSSNKDFFCQIKGESKYTINSFGEYKGSLEEMNKALYKQYHREDYSKYLLVAVFAFGLGYLVGGT